MKVKITISLLGLLTAVNSFACEFHGGFGFPSFNPFHPLAQQHILSSQTTELKITHDDVLYVSSDAQETLTLRYVIPKRYANAEISLSSSENLTLTDSSLLNLTKTKGDLAIPFSVKHPGQHQIIVRIDATQNYRPFSKIQKISIISD